MSRVLDMIWAAVVSTWEALWQWLVSVSGDESSALSLTMAAVGLLLVLILLSALIPRRARRRNEEIRPELLISRGQVRSVEASSITELSAHVSNLGEQPAQLLELAVRTDLMPDPQVFELSHLVPPGKSVDLVLELEEVHGDSGVLELYFYVPSVRRRAYRLRAELTWEPWNGRLRVEPLEQRIDVAKRLASTRLQKQRREEWRRRQRSKPAPAQPEPQLESDDEAVARGASGPRERLDFPSDF